MAKLIDNTPIHKGLEELGYKYICPCSYSDAIAEYKWKPPQREVRIKYQKRTKDRLAEGRYRVGISHTKFKDVDFYVFWVTGEKYWFLMPTAKLKSIFHAEGFNPKIEGKQWIVNICFDERRTLYPVNGERENISEFAIKHVTPT